MREYFNGYQLTDGVYTYELSKYDEAILEACILLVDNKWTIRQAAEASCFCRSTLHSHIHKKLPNLSFELYACVVRVLNENETYAIGGKNFGKRRKNH